ncbi:MAG: hypothetical protein ACI361_04405 [Atopobiaceae bacterium]
MDRALARRLAAVTEEFYAAEASSFSETRNSAWEGWTRIAELLAQEGRHELRVADIASGNLRFGTFLGDALPDVRIAYEAVDSCQPLMDKGRLPDNVSATCHVHDIVESLLDGKDVLPQGLGPADCVACFGFLHHVPGMELRLHLVQELVGAAVPGGIIALALWRFAEDPAHAKRAEATTDEACQELGIARDGLDYGDYLLGWQGKPGIWRFCHSFTDTEAREMADAVSSESSVLECYLADGKTHDQNRYLVLRKRS